MQGVRVWSLVREIIAHMLHGAASKENKAKNCEPGNEVWVLEPWKFEAYLTWIVFTAELRTQEKCEEAHISIDISHLPVGEHV